MFFRHEREGDAFTLTMEQDGTGVRNAYFLRGRSEKGTLAPLIFRRLPDFMPSLTPAGGVFCYAPANFRSAASNRSTSSVML
jgi:hypothetical protein